MKAPFRQVNYRLQGNSRLAMGEGDNKKGFQFLDRRRFDASGNERELEPAKILASEESSATMDGSKIHDSSLTAKGDCPSKHTDQGAPLEASQRPTTEADPSEPHPDPEGEVTFTSFVMSLATQTMVQLGEMDPPPGMEIPIDVESASHTIEIISMLQRKTKGNLSSDESRFVIEVLNTLRMSYVRKAP